MLRMILKCVTDGVSTLTREHLYEAKVDKNRDLRVKNDKGRWSKYSTTNFLVVLAGNQALLELLRAVGPKDVDDILTPGVSTVQIHKLHGTPSWYSISDTVVYVRNINTLDKDKPGYDDFVIDQFKDVSCLDDRDISAHTYMGVSLSSIWVDTSKVNELIDKTSEHVEEVREEPKPKAKEKDTMSRKPKTLREYLLNEGVPNDVITSLGNFRAKYKLENEQLQDRIPQVQTLFRGGKVLTAAITALLEGQNILLQGAKATGKNLLANNLAFFFGRPLWDISFHVNMDASSLIGAETFKNDQVEFRPGSVYNCAIHGGFGVLDEVNMAKNEAMAVLHSVTDDRRIIDVPGYDRIKLDASTRFIATMNYGYAGTRELNEAFASRFVIIHVPELDKDGLTSLFKDKFPNVDKSILSYYAKCFVDLQKKAQNAEIGTHAVDLRGFISALKMTRRGMTPYDAMEVNVINKVFDEYEREIVADTVSTTISKSWDSESVFTEGIMVDFSEVK